MLREYLKKLSTKEIYYLIRHFDFEVGECFIDYNETYVQNSNLIFYLLGKNIINKSKINELTSNNLIITSDLNEIFFYCGITNDYEKRLILAEITQSFDVLLNRLNNAFKDHNLNINLSDDFKDLISKEYDALRKKVRAWL